MSVFFLCTLARFVIETSSCWWKHTLASVAQRGWLIRRELDNLGLVRGRGLLGAVWPVPFSGKQCSTSVVFDRIAVAR